jgi:hypothetical protein
VTRLTTERRKELPQDEFALPGGHYPINDIEHGRKALQLDHHASPAERREIEAKVHAKFPSIDSGK